MIRKFRSRLPSVQTRNLWQADLPMAKYIFGTQNLVTRYVTDYRQLFENPNLTNNIYFSFRFAVVFFQCGS